jgi:hypothetical protein
MRYKFSMCLTPFISTSSDQTSMIGYKMKNMCVLDGVNLEQ